MPLHARLALFFATAIILLAPYANAAPKRGVTIDPFDSTYGLYLNDSKVGWMRTTATVTTERTTLGFELHASVGGMGQVAALDIIERRIYEGPAQLLSELSFAQKAATGTVSIKGRREGDELVLTTTAGKAAKTERIKTRESLADATAAMRLAKAGEVGAKATTEHFDPSMQRAIKVYHEVVAEETLTLAGIPASTFKVAATYPELEITETTWYDQAGKALETKIGGFFVARLEPPEVARKLDYQQDLLAAAVVKVPRPIADPEKLEKLSLRFTGFGDLLPASSPRQRVTREREEIVLELVRDAPPPRLTIAKLAVSPAVAPDLAPTAFIQSDAPKIIAAAKKAAGGATLVSDIIARLTSFVATHVRDEYVPAYSNALEVLESGRGDCTEHSVLFVALARALGLPARVVVGIAYWPAGGGFGWHAWTEVFAGDGWLAVDPTWGQPIADVTHVKLASGGPAEQARIVMLLGRLRVVAMSP